MEESQIEAIIDAWMTENKHEADELGMNIEDIQTEFIQVEVRGYKIQVTMPPSFDDVGSDCALFAINIEGEEDHDENFVNALEALNEKLERIKIGPDCLHTVLNNILQIFVKYGCRKPAKEGSKPHVYRLVEDVNLECQAVTNVDGILPWCFVSLNQNLGVVELEMNIKGIMGGDRVAPTLGFSFDDPLVIHLHFTDGIWYMKEVSLHNFRSVQVAVKQVPRRLRQMQNSVEEAIQELDEKTADAIAKCFPSSKLCQYGPHVLVPQFVQEFFRNCQSEPDGSFNVKGHPQIANSSNIFVALLSFVGSKLKSLRNQCVICEKQLPSLSGLWYCNAELCLYRFEEMAVGASVLQKLNGLRCLSDTKYMSTGKTHGVGIYFATDMNTSYNYASTFSLRVQRKSKDYAVLALCEIFGGENHKNSSGYLVVPPQNEKDVVIRYLLVFDRRVCDRNHNARINGNTNLQEHYRKTRSQYIRWTEETYAIPNEQDLEAFKEKKLNAQSA